MKKNSFDSSRNISEEFCFIYSYIANCQIINNTTLLDAAIAYKCFRHNYGELKLSVFDLLSNNTNVNRPSSAYYADDTESNTLQ